MKAAILHQLGNVPCCENFPDPIPHNGEEVLMEVKAASVKNLDRLRVSGKHYASYTELPVVVGFDGAGLLENGIRVYAQGLSGTIAQKALISKGRYTIVPDNLDFVIAAALPNAVIGAGMALQFRGGMKKGYHVLINGATGVTGMIAVQIAKHWGASKITVTGRNPILLEKSKMLGADDIISLKQEEGVILSQLKQSHSKAPFDLVIDYLWGRPMELILQSLKGGSVTAYTPKVKVVTIGSMAGEHISLSSGTLRSSDIELLGSGLGSLSGEEFRLFSDKLLPEMFKLAAEGKLFIETEQAALEDISGVWQRDPSPGKRTVICM
jgi:NADPH:quinone reductase-like Zn-dependent oxidoreductase